MTLKTIGSKLIWYLPDGTIKVSTLCVKHAGDSIFECFERFRLRKIETEPEFADYEYDYIDEDALPDRKDREKWRGKKGEGIYIDHTIITSAEKRQAIEDELDAELTQTNPDPVKAMKLQRKLEKRDY